MFSGSLEDRVSIHWGCRSSHPNKIHTNSMSSLWHSIHANIALQCDQEKHNNLLRGREENLNWGAPFSSSQLTFNTEYTFKIYLENLRLNTRVKSLHYVKNDQGRWACLAWCKPLSIIFSSFCKKVQQTVLTGLFCLHTSWGQQFSLSIEVPLVTILVRVFPRVFKLMFSHLSSDLLG